MKRVRQKSLTSDDIKDLKVCVAALSVVPDVGTAFSPDSINELKMNGSAHIIIPINSSGANGIWEMMSISKDHEKSAYRHVMAAERITLTADLFKAGTLFTTIYIAHVNISCWGAKNFKVELGTVAAKRISLVVDRLVQLLLLQKPIALSTDDALVDMHLL